ncbi:MarR family winged helix-turn-helix transcriptional regulator [Labedella populi]|nr:MarR family transcriptional regulator [Labedella populi]
MTEQDDPRDHLYAAAPRSTVGGSTIRALQTLSRSTQDADALALQGLGMGPLDVRALLHIIQRNRHGHVVRPGDLVTTLHVTSAAITKLVDRLVRAGRIERTPDPHDRRAVVITATESAIADITEAFGHIHSPLVAVVDEFTDAELAVVARFSVRLAASLSRETHGEESTGPLPLLEPTAAGEA